MDIQVARFREVLSLLKPVVPRKTAVPVLTNVMLKDGQAVATDLETIVKIPVPEADISCLIPYAGVTTMLQYVHGGEFLHIEPDAGTVRISWPDGSSTFNSSDPEDFPAMPEIEAVVEASLDGDILFPAMVSVLRYTAKDEARPILRGVTLAMGEPFRIAAGDGFRMAYQDLSLSFPQDTLVILPPGSVSALHHLWVKTPRTPPPSDDLIPVLMAKKYVSVAFDGKTGLRFCFGEAATAIVKRVDGSPPDWLKLIPKGEPSLQVQVFAPELELAVRRVQAVALASDGIVRMVFGNDTLTVSAKADNQQIESLVQTINAKGDPNRVALAVGYLLDYLAGKDGLVVIALTSEGAPVMLQHKKDPRVLIMPMQANWGDSPQKPEEPDGDADQEPEEPADETDLEPAE